MDTNQTKCPYVRLRQNTNRVPKRDDSIANTSRPAPSRRSSLDRRDHVARRRRPRATHAERRACRALDPDARLRLEVRSRRSPWTPPFAPIISPERFRSSASRQRHRAFNVPPDVEHARRLSAFSGRSRPRTPTDSRRSMARRDTANAPARREPKRALPPRPRARTERSIRNTTSSIHQKRLGKSARERLRESRVASTRRLTTTLSPFLTRVTDFSCA